MIGMRKPTTTSINEHPSNRFWLPEMMVTTLNFGAAIAGPNCPRIASPHVKLAITLATLAFTSDFTSMCAAQETMDQLGKALIAIERANHDCRVSLDSLGHIHERGGQEGQSPVAAILVYSVTDCGGGNNWRVEISVQKVLDDRLQPLLGLKEFIFADAHSISFSDDNASLDVDTYADGDSRCCPSLRRKAKITFLAKIASIEFSNLRKISVPQ
jgi:hypothetical protein